MSQTRNSLTLLLCLLLPALIIPPNLPAQSLDAAQLHEEAIVVDGHVHIVTPVFHQGIDPWKVQETGLFDYARAKQGGLDVVVHTVYIEDPYNNYCAGSAGTGERALRGSVDAALRAGIFKASGSIDPMGFGDERERGLPRP